MGTEFLDHAFVVPAYGRSPYLAGCLDSLLAQRYPSEIVVATSTPNEEIAHVCEIRGIRLHVHSPNMGIANDWNQALATTKAKLVTVAHQDDVYYPDYSDRIVSTMLGSNNLALAFTDYVEFTDAGPRPRDRLLRIKRVLLELAFLGRKHINDRFSKRNVLRFACPIPCPAVTINTKLYGDGFDEAFRVNLDWATWLRIAESSGGFAWIRQPLMGHRIHAESETSAAIYDGRRQDEDRKILMRLWPKSIADLIRRSYSLAYSSNHAEPNP